MMDLKTPETAEPTPEQKQKKKPTWYFCVFQTVAVLVLVILSLEGMFAMARIGEEEYLKPDPVTGFAPMPNKSVTKKGEGLGQATFNKYGLPEPERALVKPANTVRVAVIGDSFVEALQVERKESFCYLLEQDLNKKYPGTHFEVMNFGVAGYNLGQMYLRMKTLAFQFKPDMVILPVRCDTTFVLRPTPAIDLTTARPYFFVDGNNQLVTDYNVHSQWMKTTAGKRMRMTGWLREHSRIWGVTSLAVQQMMGWYQNVAAGAGWGATVTTKKTAFAEAPVASDPSAQAVDMAKKSFMIGNTKVSSESYYEARDKGIQYFWPMVDAIIVAIKRECDAQNCKLIMMQLPGAGGSSNPMETKMFKQTAGRLSIPFCDETAEMAKVPADKLYYRIHFTPAGHSLYAQKIEPFVFQNVSPLLEKK